MKRVSIKIGLGLLVMAIVFASPNVFADYSCDDPFFRQIQINKPALGPLEEGRDGALACLLHCSKESDEDQTLDRARGHFSKWLNGFIPRNKSDQLISKMIMMYSTEGIHNKGTESCHLFALDIDREVAAIIYRGEPIKDAKSTQPVVTAEQSDLTSNVLSAIAERQLHGTNEPISSNPMNTLSPTVQLIFVGDDIDRKKLELFIEKEVLAAGLITTESGEDSDLVLRSDSLIDAKANFGYSLSINYRLSEFGGTIIGSTSGSSVNRVNTLKPGSQNSLVQWVITNSSPQLGDLLDKAVPYIQKQGGTFHRIRVDQGASYINETVLLALLSSISDIDLKQLSAREENLEAIVRFPGSTERMFDLLGAELIAIFSDLEENPPKLSFSSNVIEIH